MAAEPIATPGRLSLLVDADDTLWENNIYFEQAFDDFYDFLGHSSLTPAEVRDVLDEIERVNSKIHGYGSRNFGRNLRQCYERLVERHIREEDCAAVIAFAERILEQPMEIISGVPETLAYLSERHDLFLFTKGHREEQQMKVDRSGLADFFVHTAIVKEKNVAAYQNMVAEQGLNLERTWMIGNSPKSDINPALSAGLRAAFVPHPRTWVLEREPLQIADPGRLIQLNSFTELKSHF